MQLRTILGSSVLNAGVSSASASAGVLSASVLSASVLSASVLSASVLLAACTPSPAPQGPAVAHRAPLPTPSATTSSTVAPEPDPAPVAAQNEAPSAPSHFPPAAIAPPFEKTAQPNDGVWQAMGLPGERAQVTPPVLVRTVIHPHPASRFHSLDIVAIDLSRVALFHVPGSEDHDVKRLPKAVPPGLVPAEQQASLLAVFNGGFQAQHGYWGMMAAGQTLLPAKDIGCTVAVSPEAVHIAPWTALASGASTLQFFRQTPPCLLDNGEIHRQLLAKNDRMWGGKNWHEKTRRRSALGLNEAGTVLLYAVGTELEPLGLAQAMKFAGARQAAELDINWNWTRFLLFGMVEDDPALRVTSTLLEGMPHNSRSYVVRAEARDFFYLTLKDTARP